MDLIMLHHNFSLVPLLFQKTSFTKTLVGRMIQSGNRCCPHLGLGLGKSNAAEYASMTFRAAQTCNNKSNLTKQRVKVIAALSSCRRTGTRCLGFKDYLDESFVKKAGLLETGQ